MESKIAAEFRMNNGITVFFLFISRIDGLHTSVETQYKEIQVKTQSQTICHGNLLIELVKFKLTSRLVFIIPYCPDIPGIYKELL